jgi:hypothetical protein
MPMVSRSDGFRGLAQLLPGLGGWLLDRRVTHGRSRAAAPGPTQGAPGGFGVAAGEPSAHSNRGNPRRTRIGDRRGWGRGHGLGKVAGCPNWMLMG